MHLNHVTALTFDLDDTLWPFRLALARAESALHAWLLANVPGIARVLPDCETLGKLRAGFALSRPDLTGDFVAIRKGSITQLLQLADADVALADAAYDVFYRARQDVVLYDDVLPSLAWLGARFPLIAVSNGNANLQLTGVGRYFRGHLSAREFGIAKPDAAIFMAAADKAGVAPANVLHVGDDFELDVMGALNAGMQAAWLVREDHPGRSEAPSRVHTSHTQFGGLAELCRALGQ